MEPGLDQRAYEEITDLPRMVENLEEYLEDYNNQFSTPMPLVIFLDFAEHVARINRVLNQPAGNVLLLGVGGSGRQSSTRLAAFLNDNQVFQIEVAKGYGMLEFKEDVKNCLKKCGIEGLVQVRLGLCWRVSRKDRSCGLCSRKKRIDEENRGRTTHHKIPILFCTGFSALIAILFCTQIVNEQFVETINSTWYATIRASTSTGD